MTTYSVMKLLYMSFAKDFSHLQVGQTAQDQPVAVGEVSQEFVPQTPLVFLEELVYWAVFCSPGWPLYLL